MLMKLSNRVRSVSLQRLQMATVEVHAPSSNSSSQKRLQGAKFAGNQDVMRKQKEVANSDKSYKPKNCQVKVKTSQFLAAHFVPRYFKLETASSTAVVCQVWKSACS